MKLTKDEIRSLLAKIYYNACLDCGTDMKELADVLEYLSGILSHENGYIAWNRIKIDRQRFDKKPYIDYLALLRQQYYQVLTEKIKLQIQECLKQNKQDAAFAIWKKEYFGSLATWKSQVYIPLCEIQGMSNGDQQPINRFRELNQLINETKWADSYPYYCELASDDSLDAFERSCFEITAGQVQLYWMPDYKQSLLHFERAVTICPANAKTLMGLGEYYIKLQEFEKARSYLLSAISMDPHDTDNYLRMGDSYKDENKPDAAGQWYTDALNTNFLEVATYSKMIALYADPEQLEARRPMVESMVQKVEILEPNTSFSNELYHLYRDAGNSYLTANDIESAHRYFQKAIDLKPELTAAMADMGNMYSKSGHYTLAEEWFNKVLARSGDNFDAYWGLAWVYDQQKKIEEAEKAYTQCLALRPSWTDSVYNFMGVMFDNNKEFEKALVCYQKALAFSDKEPVYYENLRDLLVKMNRKEELEPVLIKMHELFPDNPGYSFKLGQFYDDRQQTEKAIFYYQEAISGDPANPTYLESLGLAHEKLNQLEEAEKNYLKSHELQETYLTCNRLGIFYYQQQDYEKAISYYQKAISLNEKDAVLRGNIGLAYEYHGNTEEAEKAYIQSIDINPSEGAAYNRLGLFYYNQQQYSKAVSQYKIALERQPDHPVYLRNLAYACECEKQWAEAVPLYEKLTQHFPEDPSMKLRLGISLFKTGRYQEALNPFNEIREHYSNDLPYLEYLAKAYELTGDNNNALAAYKEALKVAPDDEYLNSDIGLLYYNMGAHPENIQRALDHYQKALTVNPDVAVYHYYQALAYSNLENGFEKSEQAYQKAISLDRGNDLYHNQYGVLLYNHALYEEAIEEYKQAIERNNSVAIYYNNLGIAYQALNDEYNSSVAFEKARLVEESASLQP